MTAPRGPLLGFREGRNAATRIPRLRAEAGLRQEDLAEKLGRKRSWLAARERGEIRLSVTEAELIATALDTDLAGLAEGDAA